MAVALAIAVDVIVNHGEAVARAQVLHEIDVVLEQVGELADHRGVHAGLASRGIETAADDAMGDLLAHVHVALLDGQRGLHAIESNGCAAGCVFFETEAVEAAVVIQQKIEFLPRPDAVQRAAGAAGGIHHRLQVTHAEAAVGEDVRQRLPGLYAHGLPVVLLRCGDAGRDFGYGKRQQRMNFRQRRRAHRTGPGGHDEAGEQGDQHGRSGQHPAFPVPRNRFHFTAAVERPMRTALVEVGMPLLCLSANGLPARETRPPIVFCHAVRPAVQSNKLRVP